MTAVAGYEDWSRRVQQALIWLGMADPFGGMATARAMDPNREELRKLLNMLKKYRSELAGRFTMADCERLAEDHDLGLYERPIYKRPDLRELMTFHGKIGTRSFGRLIMKHRDRIEDGWSIQFVSEGRTGNAHRLVGPPEQLAPAAPRPPQQYEVVGPASSDAVCDRCSEPGEVMKIKRARPGAKAEVLHERCAVEWFRPSADEDYSQSFSSWPRV